MLHGVLRPKTEPPASMQHHARTQTFNLPNPHFPRMPGSHYMVGCEGILGVLWGTGVLDANRTLDDDLTGEKTVWRVLNDVFMDALRVLFHFVTTNHIVEANDFGCVCFCRIIAFCKSTPCRQYVADVRTFFRPILAAKFLTAISLNTIQHRYSDGKLAWGHRRGR